MRTTSLLLALAVLACGDDGTPSVPAGDAGTGTLRLLVAADGLEVDSVFTVDVQEGLASLTRDVHAGVPVELELSPGPHTVSLGGLAENCTLVEGRPYTVSVDVGATTAAGLTVRCDAYAYLLVVAAPDSPSGVQFVVRCKDVECGLAESAGGQALLRTTAGNRILSLPCGIEVPATAVAGDTVRVEFVLACQGNPGDI